jgi:hypothetical protein
MHLGIACDIEGLIACQMEIRDAIVAAVLVPQRYPLFKQSTLIGLVSSDHCIAQSFINRARQYQPSLPAYLIVIRMEIHARAPTFARPIGTRQQPANAAKVPSVNRRSRCHM